MLQAAEAYITPVDLPQTSGVYRIRNLLSGKVYVGSAVNFQKRWRQHLTKLRCDRHFNRHLQAAWSRDGEAAFAFEVIEECAVDQLLAVEQQHIDRTGAADRRCGYNSRPRAESNLGRKCSTETLERMRQASLGKKQSPELIERRIAPLRGRNISAAHKRAISAGNLGRARPDIAVWASKAFGRFSEPEAVTIRTLYEEGMTMRVLAEQYGCAASTIHRVVHAIGPRYSSK